MEQLIKQSDLHNYVITDIIDVAKEEYNGDIAARVIDIQRGLSTGIVSSLIYYRDTTAFYNRYRADINNLLYTVCEAVGLCPQELLRGFDQSDPLCIGTQNQNLLTWFAYEEISYQLANIIL